MFELGPYHAVLAHQFGALMTRFKLRLVPVNEHLVRLAGSSCTLEIGTERHQPDMQIVFIDSAHPEKRFTLLQVLERKNLLGRRIFTDHEIAGVDGTTDHIERAIYFRALLVSKVGVELLAGNFSAMT